jgi:hypothetical protein
VKRWTVKTKAGVARTVAGERFARNLWVKVPIVRQPTGNLHGVSLSRYKVGTVYDMPATLATYFIVEGFAEAEMRRNDEGHLSLSAERPHVCAAALRHFAAYSLRHVRHLPVQLKSATVSDPPTLNSHMMPFQPRAAGHCHDHVDR